MSTYLHSASNLRALGYSSAFKVASQPDPYFLRPSLQSAALSTQFAPRLDSMQDMFDRQVNFESEVSTANDYSSQRFPSTSSSLALTGHPSSNAEHSEINAIGITDLMSNPQTRLILALEQGNAIRESAKRTASEMYELFDPSVEFVLCRYPLAMLVSMRLPGQCCEAVAFEAGRSKTVTAVCTGDGLTFGPKVMGAEEYQDYKTTHDVVLQYVNTENQQGQAVDPGLLDDVGTDNYSHMPARG